jgi:hypothetical protein
VTAISWKGADVVIGQRFGQHLPFTDTARHRAELMGACDQSQGARLYYPAVVIPLMTQQYIRLRAICSGVPRGKHPVVLVGRPNR